MYITYSGKGDQYASAAVSKRDGKKTSIEYIYLGTVIDRDKGVYKNKDRGLFTFDPVTGQYGEAPDEYINAEVKSRVENGHVSVDFGDAFIVNAFLQKSGYMDVIDTIPYSNRDTLHAMVLFYTLSTMSNSNAINWYNGSIARDLYPRANMNSQRISEMLKKIGTPENQIIFQKAHIQFVLSKYSADRNILIDSSGLPNGIQMPLTQRCAHGGSVDNEVRLIFVVQKSTGIPLYYHAVPGNIIDSTMLERVFLHLDSLGVDIESCVMDCGYNTSDNLDLFYTEEHKCKIDFITRVRSDDKRLQKMIREDLPTIDKKEHFIKYEDRYLFIVKREIKVGKNEDNPGWMYLGVDFARMTADINKLMKKATQKNLTKDEVYESIEKGGLFGIVSGKEYSCEAILPAYYQRLIAEQTFDFSKSYTKLLPLNVETVETFNGHLMLSYISSCIVKYLQLELKTADLFLGSRLQCLRNQKCTIYKNRLVTDMPPKEINDIYKILDIECPASIPIVNGFLQYKSPQPFYKDKTKTPIKKSNECNEGTVQKRGRGRPKGSKNKNSTNKAN